VRADRHWLDMAARAALRGAGLVEPNPMVGAALVRDGVLLGIGHHRRFGAPHAEAEALADCRGRGLDPAGATMYVTLEPCAHTGRNPPCTRALIGARVRRVVCAARDPNPVAAGGSAELERAGIPVRFSAASRLALDAGAAFVKRIETGRPWVLVKWAQSIDGRVATRTGESRWISGPAARAWVHRRRARVDAVLTGLGTVFRDDPELTARGVARVRRAARRVVLDPLAQTPPGSKLVRSAASGPPLVLYAADRAFEESAVAGRAGALRALGAEVVPMATAREQPAQARFATEPERWRLDLGAVLDHLARFSGVSTVLVEAGPALVGSLLDADLADELAVFVAPMMMADAEAVPPAHGRVVDRLAGARRYALRRVRPLGGDVLLQYQRAAAT